MTPRELAAFRAGIQQAAEWALVTALSLELRDDAGELRQQAAASALRAFAEGLKADTTHRTAGGEHHADAQHA